MEVQCGRKAKVAEEGSGDLSDESDFYGILGNPPSFSVRG